MRKNIKRMFVNSFGRVALLKYGLMNYPIDKYEVMIIYKSENSDVVEKMLESKDDLDTLISMPWEVGVILHKYPGVSPLDLVNGHLVTKGDSINEYLVETAYYMLNAGNKTE